MPGSIPDLIQQMKRNLGDVAGCHFNNNNVDFEWSSPRDFSTERGEISQLSVKTPAAAADADGMTIF